LPFAINWITSYESQIFNSNGEKITVLLGEVKQAVNGVEGAVRNVEGAVHSTNTQGKFDQLIGAISNLTA